MGFLLLGFVFFIFFSFGKVQYQLLVVCLFVCFASYSYELNIISAFVNGAFWWCITTLKKKCIIVSFSFLVCLFVLFVFIVVNIEFILALGC